MMAGCYTRLSADLSVCQVTWVSLSVVVNTAPGLRARIRRSTSHTCWAEAEGVARGAGTCRGTVSCDQDRWSVLCLLPSLIATRGAVERPTT